MLSGVTEYPLEVSVLSYAGIPRAVSSTVNYGVEQGWWIEVNYATDTDCGLGMHYSVTSDCAVKTDGCLATKLYLSLQQT